MQKSIRSFNLEKHVLAGLLKHPKVYFDVSSILSDGDFSGGQKTIFGVIRSQILADKPLDPAILAEKIKNLGITFQKQDFNVFDYLESLSYIKINEKSLVQACKDLKTITIRREICETVTNVAKAMEENNDMTADALISLADKMYNEKISAYDLESSPEDLFGDIDALIEGRANNPVDEMGLLTPYKKFNEMYGGLRNGQLYAWVSRPKHGKSTILNDICTKASILNPNTQALILDTEMPTVDMKFRIASSVTGIPVWFLETGNFKKSKDYLAMWMAHKTELKMALGKVDHLQVPGKPMNEIESIIQRWYLSKVGRGNPAIVVYDYIKLTGEAFGNKAEHQIVGDKVDQFSILCKKLNIPLLTACQLNRSAENGTDDASAISQSDRLIWYAAYVGIFRRKTLEEQAEDGVQYGSHKMIELASRYGGRNAHGHSDLVRVQDGRRIVYRKNFLNFDVKNFHVEEKGSLKDIVAEQAGMRVDMFARDEDGNENEQPVIIQPDEGDNLL